MCDSGGAAVLVTLLACVGLFFGLFFGLNFPESVVIVSFLFFFIFLSESVLTLFISCHLATFSL